MTCQTAVSLGVYVLGVADTHERQLVEAHLPGCTECRAELGRLAPLPGLLASVPPDLRPAGIGAAAPGPVPAPARARRGRFRPPAGDRPQAGRPQAGRPRAGRPRAGRPRAGRPRAARPRWAAAVTAAAA